MILVAHESREGHDFQSCRLDSQGVRLPAAAVGLLERDEVEEKQTAAAEAASLREVDWHEWNSCPSRNTCELELVPSGNSCPSRNMYE